jgi:hypothetical protein
MKSLISGAGTNDDHARVSRRGAFSRKKRYPLLLKALPIAEFSRGYEA